MQAIYGSVTKVLVDTKQNGNLLYLPLDKLMQSTSPEIPVAAPSPANASGAPSVSSGITSDIRSRDSDRSRTREAR
jgi:membrane protease subunit HflK